MTNYITPRLLQAINNLKKRYPQAFETRYGKAYRLEYWIPADDPDMRIRNRFLEKIKACDGSRKKDRPIIAKIADCYGRYMTMRDTAAHLEMDLSDVKNLTNTNPYLKNMYHKHQHDWGCVVVYDTCTKKYKTYITKVAAAKKIGFQRSAELNYYLKYRHYPHLINGRYKVKRKVWFDEDNGM